MSLSQFVESPFSVWRRLRNDPQFIQAVTNFCLVEEEERYDLAVQYATWWSPHVRKFRFEVLIILERDIAIELLIERQGRAHLLQQEDEEVDELEMYWERKQLFAFWPRWVEHAHTLIAGRIWTQQSLERLELHTRMASIGGGEVDERLQVYSMILSNVNEVPLEWGDFVPPLVEEQRASQRRERQRIAAKQEEDVRALHELYRKQAAEMERQQHHELMLAWDAGRLRIAWQWEQEYRNAVEKSFPKSHFADDEDEYL